MPEFYRKRFRAMAKDELETHSNFKFWLKLLFQRWLEGEEALTDTKRALEVFKLEEFVNRLPADLYKWIVDKKLRI